MLSFLVDMVFLAFTGKKRSYYKNNKDGTLDKQDIDAIVNEGNIEEEITTGNRGKAITQLIIVVVICALIIMIVQLILPK